MTLETNLDRAHLAYLQMLMDAGCKVAFPGRTSFPNCSKEYVWMKDRFGVHFLEELPEQNG